MPLTPREAERVEAEIERVAGRGYEEGRKEGFRRSLQAAASRILGRELEDASDLLAGNDRQTALRLIGEAARETWPERWREELGPVLSEAMSATTEPRAELLGAAFDRGNPTMDRAFGDYLVKLSGDIPGTSADEITGIIRAAQDEGLSVPDTGRRLREAAPDLSRKRGDLIARTELNRSSNLASRLQYQESPVVESISWLATNDDRTRPEHAEMNGETITPGELFSNGLAEPGEVNCRCTLIPNVGEGF